MQLLSANETWGRLRRTPIDANFFAVARMPQSGAFLRSAVSRELCQLIGAEPAGTVVVDLTDLVLADREAMRLLSDCETSERIVLRNCPAYIRVWMTADTNQ
jgi:hypothetical protein